MIEIKKLYDEYDESLKKLNLYYKQFPNDELKEVIAHTFSSYLIIEGIYNISDENLKLETWDSLKNDLIILINDIKTYINQLK